MTAVTPHAPLTPGEFAALCHGDVHVIGVGSAEGIAVTRLLLARGCAPASIILHDSRPRGELRRAFRTTHGAYDRLEQDAIWDGEIRPLLDHGRFGDEYLTGLEDAPTVSLGQGWYLDAANRAAIEAKLRPDTRVISMTELHLALAPGPVAAITGTNGKSTTAALVEHFLEVAGLPFAIAGNERSSRQPLPGIDSLERGTLLLMEISNRQLLQVIPQVHVAAITALTPDHLEEHGGWDGYVAAKRRLFEGQRPHDLAIAMADSDVCAEVAAASPGVQLGAGLDGPAVAGRYERSVAWFGDELRVTGIDAFGNIGSRSGPGTATFVLATRPDVRLLGDHNLRNVAVAAAVALACDVPVELIASALRSFTGKALRLQSLGDVDGAEVFSDLKATTPEATAAAVEALTANAPDRRLVLVAGGTDKGLDYGALAQLVAQRAAHALLVAGSATDQLKRGLDAAGGSWSAAEDLPSALDRALEIAGPGGAVLVSPAAAGFWTAQLQGGRSLQSLVRALRTRERDGTR